VYTPKQTTTLETPKKEFEKQSSNSELSEATGSKVGFVSLGCPKKFSRF
jgi:ribosomal protein S12 methylthiotransferase